MLPYYPAYPAPLFIKNTFLGFAPDRTPSLEDFFEERRVRSMPVSIDSEDDPVAHAFMSPMKGLGKPSKDEPARVPLPSTPEACSTYDSSVYGDPMLSYGSLIRPFRLSGYLNDHSPTGAADSSPTKAGAGTPAASTASGNGRTASECGDTNWDGLSPPSRGADVPVLRLAESLARPELGSEELPTQGSVGHHVGLCKPCAFLEKGCNSGINCQFCHLCDPGERRRRKKEKIAMRRQASKLQNTLAKEWGAVPGAMPGVPVPGMPVPGVPVPGVQLPSVPVPGMPLPFPAPW